MGSWDRMPFANTQMLHIWTISGRELATLPLEDLSDVWALKRRLREFCMHPASLQQVLHKGVALNNADLLESIADVQLVLVPCDGSLRNPDLRNEMIEACEMGQEMVVRILLNAGVPIWFYFMCPNTRIFYRPLDLAAQNGHVEVVRLLLSADSIRSELDFVHAFSLASRNGHAEVVRIFLEKMDELGMEARGVAFVDSSFALAKGEGFSEACSSGHAEIVHLLLKHGSVTADDLKRGLCIAAGNGHAETARFLLAPVSSAARAAALLRASAKGHANVAEVLLEAGVVSSALAKALRKASGRGHLEVVRLLSKPGATNRRGLESALVKAGRRRQRKAEYLLRRALAIAKAGQSRLSRGMKGKLAKKVLQHWNLHKLSVCNRSQGHVLRPSLQYVPKVPAVSPF